MASEQSTPASSRKQVLRRSVRYYQEQMEQVNGILSPKESRSPIITRTSSTSSTSSSNSPVLNRISDKPKRSTEPNLHATAASTTAISPILTLLSTSPSLPALSQHVLPPSLEDVINNSKFWHCFNQYLSELNASESLLFLRDVASGCPVRDIYEKYIRDGSPFEVNICGSTRKKLASVFENNSKDLIMNNSSPVSHSVFNQAKNEVQQMLNTGLFTDWLNTGEWQSI